MKVPMIRWLASFAALGLLVGVTSGSTQAWDTGMPPVTGEPSGANTVSGEAFGVSVKALVLGAAVSVGPTPHVVLPPSGGMVADQVLNINVPNLAAPETLEVITTGS